MPIGTIAYSLLDERSTLSPSARSDTALLVVFLVAVVNGAHVASVGPRPVYPHHRSRSSISRRPIVEIVQLLFATNMRAVTLFSRMPHGRRAVTSMSLVQVAAATEATASAVGRLGARTRHKTYCSSNAAGTAVREEGDGEEASTFDIGDGVVIVFDTCPPVVERRKVDKSCITADTVIERTNDRRRNETSRHQAMTLTTGSRIHRPMTTGLHPVSRR